jgi:hypothetical protein
MIHNWHCTKDMHFLSYNSIICCNILMAVLEVRQKCHIYNRRLSKSKETAALNCSLKLADFRRSRSYRLFSLVSKFAETASTTKPLLRKLIISLCARLLQALHIKVFTA